MPDNRLPTNQSLIDLKDSIDLLTANINRTASNIPYDSNLTIKAAIDGKVSKTGDTMTGNLLVDRGLSGDSNVLIGGNVSRGVLRLYHTNGKYANIYPYGFTENRNITLPDNGGTLGVEGTVSNITITNNQGGAEANKATMYYTGKIGIISGQFRCQRATSEQISFDLPSGWRLGYGGVVLRDASNGNIVSAWTNDNYIETYNHTGTMTVGNLVSFTIPVYRTT